MSENEFNFTVNSDIKYYLNVNLTSIQNLIFYIRNRSNMNNCFRILKLL